MVGIFPETLTALVTRLNFVNTNAVRFYGIFMVGEVSFAGLLIFNPFLQLKEDDTFVP